MPSKSDKQRKFMAAAANNPKFAKKAGISQGVAQEFHQADKKKKRFQVGGFRPSGPGRGGVIPGRVPNGVLGAVNRRQQGSANRLRQLSKGSRGF